jgi:ribosome-associated toxin RatA of RatAB toxin-antitoxin module
MPGVNKSAVIRGISPKALFDVVTDYESYPRFFTDFAAVRILEKKGDTWTVEFKVGVPIPMVKEVSYVLAITNDAAGLKTRWTFVRGQAVSDSKGGWTFTQTPDGTKVDYEAQMEVNVPLPGFVKSKIQDLVLSKSIATMMDQLEKETRRRGLK